jgi:GT2 family glycosyltransferase
MSNPRLSVVIPTYNRSAVLGRCLDALRDQGDAARHCELIVADDGSGDDTLALARSRAAAFAGDASAPAVVVLTQANAGANRARNRAIAVARGAVLLFINDDTIARPGFLATHLQAHDAEPDERVAVLGRVTVSPELPPSRLAPLHLDRAFASLADGEWLDWRAFFTCNVSVKATLLARGGLFEEGIRYHEDLELAQRLSHHGLRVWYRAAALGWHDHFLTEREFFAIAAREARALATWARLQPQLAPLLGTLGYEPAQPLARRLRHRLLDALVGGPLAPAWRALARHAPAALEPLSRRLYDQLYQCLRRSHLRHELHAAPSARGPALP